MSRIDATKQMTDIIHVGISYSGIEREIIGSPIFNRLHRILQSSMVYLSFASNKVKRFEHSVGTMHLAGKMFYYSLCNAKPLVADAFFLELEEYLRGWRQSANERIKFINREIREEFVGDHIFEFVPPYSEIYEHYCPAGLNPKKKLLYLMAFQAIRLVGLLHDVGHLPYSHVMEYALADIIKRVEAIENKEDNHKEFLMAMQEYVHTGRSGDKIEIHEVIGSHLAKKLCENIEDNLSGIDEEVLFVPIVFDLMQKIIESSPSENTLFGDLHLIVDGVVDADRLDYCSRDAFCTGTRKDIFPYERFLPTYQLIKENCLDSSSEGLRRRFLFSPSIKSVREIEDLLLRRWRIFSDINYHHRVQKHELLLRKVLVYLAMQEFEDKKLLDKEIPNILPFEISSIWRLILLLKQNESIENRIIQLDDSWLDTLLKNKFFDKYAESYTSYKRHGNDTQWNRFHELISTHKHYHSLFKRADDFRVLDILVFEAAMKDSDVHKFLFEKNHLLFGYTGSKSFDAYGSFVKERNSLFCSRIMQYFYTTCGIEEALNRISRASKGKRKSLNLNIEDCLFCARSFSRGTDTSKKPVFLASENGEAERLERHWVTPGIMFTIEMDLSPPFFVYYLPHYDTDKLEQCSVQIDTLQNTIVEGILQVIKEDAGVIAKK